MDRAIWEHVNHPLRVHDVRPLEPVGLVGRDVNPILAADGIGNLGLELKSRVGRYVVSWAGR